MLFSLSGSREWSEERDGRRGNQMKEAVCICDVCWMWVGGSGWL